ncbi:MAG: GIY-YIG nuclease family protein [Nanoarchaeota archaeon]|nr:GIY-YIG nuclease family protein [Nanoarchaeota archaeon]
MTKIKIKLSNIIRIDNPTLYKGHFAVWNGDDEPLDVFVQDKDNWKSWQEYRPYSKKKSIYLDCFSRDFIFSFVRFYPRGDEYWLFGGIWEVIKRNNRYKVKLCDLGREFIGRLLVEYQMGDRAKRVNFEKHYPKIIVSEIFDQEFSGEDFPGSNNIDIEFIKLKHIFQINKSDWKSTLEHIDGIYLITDTKNGKKYVGSAYGGEGIWSRWKKYIYTGHGGNQDLRRLIDKKGLKYAEKNFKFAILETYKFGTSDDTIDSRESYWKSVFMSRDEQYGYNKN